MKQYLVAALLSIDLLTAGCQEGIVVSESSDDEITQTPEEVISEIEATGELPDAPSAELIQAVVLLADISGFTKLGEKLTAEHGDERGRPREERARGREAWAGPEEPAGSTSYPP